MIKTNRKYCRTCKKEIYGQKIAYCTSECKNKDYRKTYIPTLKTKLSANMNFYLIACACGALEERTHNRSKATCFNCRMKKVRNDSAQRRLAKKIKDVETNTKILEEISV